MMLAVVALLLVGSIYAAGSVKINAFQDGETIHLTYYNNFTCYPAPSAIYANSSQSINASSITACEFGSSAGVDTANSIPRWALIPAFAGLSVYGYNALGSTPKGYPTYNGQPIITICGAGQSPNACMHRPGYVYSPILSAIEQGANIPGGINGLPEGVLPNAARDILVSQKKNGTVVSSYEVRVWVFDPNIFPNTTTGTCAQIAPSNLSDPTAHCLTSVAALQAAIGTNDTAIPTINANNILWEVAGRPDTQVTILNAVLISSNSAEPQFGVQQSSNLTFSNTNMFTYSFIGNSVNQTAPTSTTTIAQEQQAPGASSIIVPTVLIIIAIIGVWSLAKRRKGAKKARRK